MALWVKHTMHGSIPATPAGSSNPGMCDSQVPSQEQAPALLGVAPKPK